MGNPTINFDIEDVLARIEMLESKVFHRSPPRSLEVPSWRAFEMAPADLFGLEPVALPPRVAVEPFDLGNKVGKWRCDPRVINVLVIQGRPLPFTQYVLYKALNVAWVHAAGAQPYTTVCPRGDFGGLFPKLKLHALVFGMGGRGVGCQTSMGIDGSPGEPVWMAVNDTTYEDNQGEITMQASWV